MTTSSERRPAVSVKWLQQIYSLHYKALLVHFRNGTSLLVTLLLPVLVAAVVLQAAKSYHEQNRIGAVVEQPYYQSFGNPFAEHVPWKLTSLQSVCEQFNISATLLSVRSPSFSCARILLAPYDEEAFNITRRIAKSLMTVQNKNDSVSILMYNSTEIMTKSALDMALNPMYVHGAEILFTFLATVYVEPVNGDIKFGVLPLHDLFTNAPGSVLQEYSTNANGISAMLQFSPWWKDLRKDLNGDVSFSFYSKRYIYMNENVLELAVKATLMATAAHITSARVNTKSDPFTHLAFAPISADYERTLSDANPTIMEPLPHYLLGLEDVKTYALKVGALYTIWIMGSISLFFFIVLRIANEKRSGMLIMLRQMGMYESTYWLSHWLSMVLPALIIACSLEACYMFMLDVTWNTNRMATLWLMNLAMVSLGQMLIACISQQLTTNIVLLVSSALLIGLMPLTGTGIFWGQFSRSFLRLLMVFVPTTSASMFVSYDIVFNTLMPLATYHNTTVIELLQNMEYSPHSYEQVELHYALRFAATYLSYEDMHYSLLCGCILYSILAWYFAQCIGDNDTGLRRPFHFPFSGSRSRNRSHEGLDPTDTLGLMREKSAHESSIILHKLSKSYSGTDDSRTALREFSLTMLPGNIYTLLAGNGGGKTTLVKLLTGAMHQTHGQAFLFGSTVQENVTKMHSVLSVCRQEDVLWDEMTAYEHIYVHSLMRADRSLKELNDYIQEKLKEVGLLPDAHNLVSTFSGGMRRRLSVLLACLPQCGPGLTVLDEPCSGVDAMNRRRLWRLIQRTKRERIVLLTTHDLYEAEALGDHICILHQGVLKASGSTLFLKNNYGSSYQLRLTRNVHGAQSPIELIQRSLPTAQIISNMAGILTIAVERNHAPLLQPLLKTLQESGKGVYDWSVSNTTLEQVFLKLSEAQNAVLDESQVLAANSNQQLQLRGSQPQGDIIDRVLSAMRTKCAICHSNYCSDVPVYTGQDVEIMLRGVVCQDCIDRLEQAVTRQARREPQSTLLETILESPIADPEAVDSELIVSPVAAPSASIIEETNPLNHEEILTSHEDDHASYLQAPLDSTPYQELGTPKSKCYLLLAQVRAIFYKNFTAQWRRRKTNRLLLFVWIHAFIAMIVLATIERVHVTDSGFTSASYSSSTTEQNKISLGDKLDRSRVSNIMSSILRGCAVGSMKEKRDDSGKLVWLPCVDADSLLRRNDLQNYVLVSAFSGDLRHQQNVYVHTNINNLARGREGLDVSYFASWNGTGSAPFLISELPPQCQSDLHFVSETTAIGSHDAIFVERGDATDFLFRNPDLILGKHDNIITIGMIGSIKSWSIITTESGCTQRKFTLFDNKVNVTLALEMATLAIGGHVGISANLGSRLSKFHLSYNTSKLNPLLFLTFLMFAITFSILLPFVGIIQLISLEKNHRLLDLMRFSGLSRWTYWLGSYLSHLIYLTPPSLIILIFSVSSALIRPEETLTHFLLLLLWQNYAVGLAYAISWTFSSVSRATIFGLICALMIPASCFIFYGLDFSNYNSDFALKILLCLPSLAFADAWIGLVFGTFKTNSVIALFLHGAILLFIGAFFGPFTELISRIAGRFQSQPKETVLDDESRPSDAHLDVSVQKEQRAILTGCYPPSRVAVLAYDIVKQFGDECSKPALDHVSLALGYGEVFGLLGPNAAGKSTLINIMQGILQPTSGRIYVAGNDVSRVESRSLLTRLLGVCPQYDALWPDLTVQEHFLMHARLRGASLEEERVWTQNVAEQVELDGDTLTTCAGRLSGGQQRRLSIGIALMGRPRVILLDEPTTGIDVESRQQIWRMIDKLRQSANQCVVLTTHSMEEAEALCTRIGILVQGRLQCLGQTQLLKRRFSKGFSLRLLLHLQAAVSVPVSNFSDVPVNVLVDCEDQRLIQVQEFLDTTLRLKVNGLSAAENHGPRHRIQGSVLNDGLTVSWLLAYDMAVEQRKADGVTIHEDFDYPLFFENVEEFQRDYGVLEWGVRQASLEDVFCQLVAQSS